MWIPVFPPKSGARTRYYKVVSFFFVELVKFQLGYDFETASPKTSLERPFSSLNLGRKCGRAYSMHIAGPKERVAVAMDDVCVMDDANHTDATTQKTKSKRPEDTQ
jgi:hypothetical protein